MNIKEFVQILQTYVSSHTPNFGDGESVLTLLYESYVITLFACLTLTVMAILLGLTDMVYDPLIIWEPILETDILFCIGYAVLCLMPLILELWTDYRFATTI